MQLLLAPACSTYPLQVLVDVVAVDGGVGDELKQLSDGHHGHAALQEEVWGDRRINGQPSGTLEKLMDYCF